MKVVYSTKEAMMPSTTMQEIKAIIKETQQLQRENAEGMKELREQSKETDRKMQETDRIMKENAAAQKETDRIIGKLGNRMGEMVEYMVVPNLVEKFRDLGFDYQDAYRNLVVTDRKHGIFTEADVTLRNTESVMIVETKTKPDSSDVDEHVERMGKLREYADLHGDKRKYYGAVAGVVVNENIKQYIFKHGFYAIEPSGDTFTITAPTQSGGVRAW
jgi:hypothetical protein